MKYCVGCKHWTFDVGWSGTDVTAGDAWSAACLKGHWNISGHRVSQGEFEQYMEKADTCPDFSDRHPESEICKHE